MKRLRSIHPSATLFLGILLVFSLPFGYSAEACGPSTEPYRGADLLVLDVEGADPEYADSVAHRGFVFGWLLFAAAAVGLQRALFRQGTLWATWCAATAFMSLVFALGVFDDGGSPDIGWKLTVLIPTGGLVLKILISLGRRLARRFAPAVTTPRAPAVR